MPVHGSRSGRASRRTLSASVVVAVSASLLSTPTAAFAAARNLDSACPSGHVPSADFDDTIGTAFEAEIDCIVGYGLARGTAPYTYGPGLTVTRGQMASFLANTLVAADRQRPSGLPDAFRDDDGTPHERNIDWLAHEGVLGGFRDGTYRPGGAVTRAQMATFLNNLLREVKGARLTTSNDSFSDDDGNPHEANIDGLASQGIVTGTAAGRYSPSASVTRQQMAAFLAREVDHLVDTGHTAVPFGPSALLVEPTTAARADVSDNASSTTADRGRRTYTVAVPLDVDRVHVALLPAGQVTVTSAGAPRFSSGVPIPANAGTSIESVDGSRIDLAGGTTDVVRLADVAVHDGQLVLVVDSTVVHSVVPVVWQDTIDPAQDRLDLEAGASASTPKAAREVVAVGGAMSWGPPEPARNVNLATGTVRQVDTAGGWYTLDTGGSAAPDHLVRSSRNDAFRYTASNEPAANSPGPVSATEFASWVSIGDRIDPSAYLPGDMTHVIVGDVPAAPTQVTASLSEEGRVLVTFDEPSNPVADDAASTFRLERAPVTNSTVGTFTEVASRKADLATEFTDVPAAAGRYAYRVVSRSVTGSSPASAAPQITVTAPAPATVASEVTDHDPSGATPPSGLLDHRDTIKLTFDRAVVVDAGWEIVVRDADGTVARVSRGPSTGRIAAVQVSGTGANIVTITMDVAAPTIVVPGGSPGIALGGGFLQVISAVDIGNAAGDWNLPKSGLSTTPYGNTRVLSGRAATPAAPTVHASSASGRRVELGRDEVQTISSTPATGGTWTLSLDGETTAGIPFDADAATVDGALEALGGIGTGGVQVTGTGATGVAPFTVRFGGARSATNVTALVVDGAGLTGPTPTAPTVTTTVDGAAADGVAAGDTVRVFTTAGRLVGTQVAGANGRTTVSLSGSYTRGQGLLLVVEQAATGRHSVTRPVALDT